MRLFWLFLAISWTSPASAQDFLTGALGQFRQSLGLTVPRLDQALAGTCRDRALTLASAGVLSHRDSQGREPGLQLVAVGFSPGEYGEVLGAGADPKAVWKAWLSSKSHQSILATPGWVTWGWGSAEKDHTTVYVVRFWKP